MGITPGALVAVSGADASAGSVTSASFDSTGAGGFVFYVVHEGAATTYAWSDNKGTAGANFVSLGTVNCTTGAGNGDLSISAVFCYAPNTGTGHTVTVTFGASRPYRYIGGRALNGNFGAAFLAAITQLAQVDSLTTIDAGTLTTDAPAYLFQFGGNYNGAAMSAAGGGWAIASNGVAGRHFQERNEASSGTFDPSYTLAANPLSAVTIAVAIKEVAAVDTGVEERRGRRARPGRGPYSRGAYRRPSIDVVAPGAVVALDGAASGQGSSTGELAHGVPLGGDAGGQGSATGNLAHGVSLGGDAGGQGAASGNLAHGVPLDGAGTGQSSAAGDLTQQSPAVEALTRRNRPGRGPYSVGRYFRPRIDVVAVTQAQLFAGDAAANATASAALTLLIGLAGAGAASGSVDGALSLAKGLAGAAAAQASASGSLAVSVLLNGAAVAGSSAAGDLAQSGVVALAGAAAATGAATGSLALTVALVGASLSSSGAAGALSKTVPLNGAAVASVGGSGAIALSIALAGAALAQASASGSFDAAVQLGGAAAAAAGASGLLSINVPLAGQAQAIAQASGGLVLTVLLGGSAQASGSAGGAFAGVAALSGSAGASGFASASLEVGSPSTSHAARVRAVPRKFNAVRAPRSFRVRVPPVA